MPNLDRTFCASPDCKDECGRKWTKNHEVAAEMVGKKHISFAYFCGGGPEGETRTENEHESE